MDTLAASGLAPASAYAATAAAPHSTRRTTTSHFSASLAMAVFLGGSGALAILPETPLAQHWLKADDSDVKVALAPEPGPPLLSASLSSGADSLIWDALHPTIADDLTRVEAQPETRTVVVRRGDTLSELLVEAGATAPEAQDAVTALRKHIDPRQIKVGQEIEVTLAPGTNDLPEPVGELAEPASLTLPEGSEGPGAAMDDHGVDEAAAPDTEPAALAAADNPAGPHLLGLKYQADLTRHVELTRAPDGGFAASVIEKVLTEKAFRASATIDSSLFLAADAVGIPHSVIVEFIKLYSYDVDFQREIRKGDSFEIFFTRMVDDKGRALKEGHVLYAALMTGGETRRLWRFTPKDGDTDYFDENGKSAKKFLMRTPVDGARLSSGFGMRKHPILGYSKMHKGVDFAAPRGTPVVAAGFGTVMQAGRNGSYGNYIRIRHANGYETAYAHLNGYARGIKKGAKVSQGQTIGYVGTTGRSTGPHLHYEVLVKGAQVNPMGVKVPTGIQLAGKELKAFTAERGALETAMASAEVLGKLKTAEADVPDAGTVQQ